MREYIFGTFANSSPANGLVLHWGGQRGHHSGDVVPQAGSYLLALQYTSVYWVSGGGVHRQRHRARHNLDL